MPQARSCPVCSTPGERSTLFLEGNFDPARLSGFSFASRKTPEFMSHRLVRCPNCELVYVAQPPAEHVLAAAYHEAAYDSAQEAQDAASAYAKAVEGVLLRLPRREAALEIGTGTGIFLEHLQGSGFACVVGVEPSLAAIAAAAPHRRAWIREGMFREQDFAPASFDLVCCFMTLEHVRDPAQIADAAFRLLRPGGAFVSVTHDYQSPVNRLLGRRSPIIDIEHMQLFNRRSAVELLRRSGYERVSVAAFRNRYALRYWMRLTPLPARLKGGLLSMLRGAGLDGIKIGLNVGNAMAAGFKP